MYLAVDRSFPYHLNVFNNIPANYSSGNMVNITGNAVGVREYKNVINYLDLASTISSTYTAFGPTLSKNGVALFLCVIYNLGDKPSNKLVKYTATSQVLSTTQF